MQTSQTASQHINVLCCENIFSTVLNAFKCNCCFFLQFQNASVILLIKYNNYCAYLLKIRLIVQLKEKDIADALIVTRSS